MLKHLALVAIGSAVLMAAVPSANAGGKCGPEACLTNGTQLTGLALGNASTGSVSVVILPSGEIVALP